MRNQKGLPVRQAGQVVLILILVMTTALAIGLSVIQRSLSDVSTSSKVEQSSRAFSAAEAGIEKALNAPAGQGSPVTVSFPDNNSSATVDINNLIPAIPSGFGRQSAFECPPGDPRLSKEDIAQVWLADPGVANLLTCGPSDICYKQPALDVYWGSTAATDKAALELTLVYYAGGQYQSRKWYLDNASAGRTATNNFDPVACSASTPPGSTVSYQCRKRLGDSSGINNGSLPTTGMMLLRARLLYNTTSQPFAVQAVGDCGRDHNACIPPQARTLVSKGISGQTQRTIQVCQLLKVVPSYFDYGIFSVGDINK